MNKITSLILLALLLSMVLCVPDKNNLQRYRRNGRRNDRDDRDDRDRDDENQKDK